MRIILTIFVERLPLNMKNRNFEEKLAKIKRRELEDEVLNFMKIEKKRVKEKRSGQR